MMLDSELIFSGTKASNVWTGQRISASGATASTDYVDTLATGDAIKSPATLKVISSVIFAGTLTTLTVTLQTCAESGFSSPTTLATTGAIAKASTTAQSILAQIPIPVGVLRYLRVVYTTDNTAETTGSVIAFICLNPEKTLDRQL